jgi:gamma-glutamylcyclotransferase (GGCT)/AIG2-like uncharacterized protein YtfP
MKEANAAAIVVPIAELAIARGWRWRWSTSERDGQCHAEVKVAAIEDGRTVVKAWYGATAADEAIAIGQAVSYALEHIAQLDKIDARDRDYRRRVELGLERRAPPWKPG